MAYTSRTLWADLQSPEMLARRVRQSGQSHRALADEVALELKKIAAKERRHRRDPSSVPQGCSHALIGQLCRGEARTVHELRAIAIERALSVNEGDLFVHRMVSGVNTERTA